MTIKAWAHQFSGKILTKAEYDEITLLFYSDDSNYDAVENKMFYEENKIDIVSVAQNILSDGSKKIDVINRKGNTIVTLNLPKNLFLYLSGVKLSHFTKNGNLFLESYSKSDKGHSVDKFYMFNFYTGKLIIETDKAPIFEVSNVGYKTVFHDADNKAKIINVYNLKAEKIGSYTLKNDWQNKDYENDFDGIFPYKENGKEGLKNFSNEIIVKAVYDKVKAVGNEFYIVIKDNKYGVLNNKGSLLVTDKSEEIVYDFSTKCFKDAVTWKSYFCLDNKK